jgi:hypothetical protein
MYYVYYIGDASILFDTVVDGFYFKYQPFWIGMGRGNRFSESLREAIKGTTNNKHKSNKARKLIKEGKEIKSIVLKENLSIEDAYDIEEMLIMKFGRKGIDKNGILTNLRKTARNSYQKSLETREKIGRKNIGRIPWNKGLTKETDDRILFASKKLIGIKHTEERKKKQSVSAKKRCESIEYKKDFIKRMANEEIKEKRKNNMLLNGSVRNEKNGRWKEIDKNEFINLYSQGYTYKEMGQYFGRPVKAIRKRISLWQLPKRPRYIIEKHKPSKRKKNRFEDSPRFNKNINNEKIIECYNKGIITGYKIAKKLNYPVSTTQRRLNFLRNGEFI